MRCHLEAILAAIRVQDFIGVDWEQAEGIDGDEDMADVGLRNMSKVSAILLSNSGHTGRLLVALWCSLTHVDLGILKSAASKQTCDVSGTGI